VKEDRKTIRFDHYEEGAVIEGLNNMRKEQLEKDECADFVSELMLKILQTPTRKVRVRDEAR
jgi:hypothetical protein